MKRCLTIIAVLLCATPVAAETFTIQTANQRFRVVNIVRRTGEIVYVLLDTETGELREKLVELPPRRIKVNRRVWDPIAGRYREVVGYDARSLAVYRDEKNHAHVVYWVTEKSQFNTTPIGPELLPPPRPQTELPCCCW